MHRAHLYFAVFILKKPLADSKINQPIYGMKRLIIFSGDYLDCEMKL